MVSVTKAANSSVPKSIHGESPGLPQRSFSIFNNKGTEPSAQRGATSRGHQSLTPNRAQPRWMSQNRSGGLWL